MTKRFAHIITLSALRNNIRQFPTMAEILVQRAIIDALPPGYRRVYDWVGVCGLPVTSPMIMKAFDLQQNHASTLLNELWQFGLLKRTEYTDANGKGYKYTVAD